MIDQIDNSKQTLLPEAEGWWLLRADNLICYPQNRACVGHGFQTDGNCFLNTFGIFTAGK